MAVAVSEVERRFPAVGLLDADGLQSSLTLALALAEQADARATALALTDLGDIVLPDATAATPEDQAQIRAIAPLYLAGQLEEAGLLPAMETLSGLTFGD